MEKKMCKVTIDGVTKEFLAGMAYGEVLAGFDLQAQSEIALVAANGRLSELHKTLKQDCELSLITFSDRIGYRTYRRSASFLLLKALYKIGGQENIQKIILHHSIGDGFYYTIEGDVSITPEFIAKVKAYMNEQVTKCIPIMKRSVDIDKAKQIFRKHGMLDKERLLRYRQVSRVNIYSIGSFEDYFYGFMVWHTGYLKYFDLHAYDEGLILQMPALKEPTKIQPLKDIPKVFQTQKESESWGRMLGVDTVGAMNDLISQGGMQKLMLISEALQESKIAEIADGIVNREGVKFVMIAGPSSSGKTTFSHRLSIQLAARGLKPHPIAVDNYFVERGKTPIDEYGEPNYECLEAIDVKQFNQDMVALLKGERVDIPSFDFVKGKREYKGHYLQLDSDDILVIEGIHGLNDKLSHELPKENKYKIYISALTQLNIDEHNRVPTTDGRLIRRMVRDNRTRGVNAQTTLAMWPSVGRGEEESIFPFQEEADVMFNSALIYELAILKIYAEPLLFQIEPGEPEYYEAKRLLKFLDYFIGQPSDNILHNSILREFIGGGCFDV